MKRILSVTLGIFLLLINFKIVLAADDNTPPSIENIILENKEVNPGDILKIVIDVSDLESGFDENSYCSINLSNGIREISFLNPKYNIETRNFELNYEIPSNIQNGNWYVSWIYLKDKANNVGTLLNQDSEKYNFKVINGIDDKIEPIIEEVILSKKEVLVGEELRVIIKANDNESGFDENSYCSINLSNGIREISFLNPKYNIETRNFELNYEIPSNMQSGNWYVSWIYLKDKANNVGTLLNQDSEKYNFKVVNGIGDKTEPIIEEVILSKKEVLVGEELRVIIKANDNESGFDENSYCSIDLSNGIREISFLNPKYNIETRNFELNYKIPSNMQSGNWYVSWIYLKDKANNAGTLLNQDSKKYNFKVESSFNGTENKSIKKGETFNPLEGVVAINNLDGDFTNKITYEGNIDTNKEGIYLIKYEAVGNSGYVYNDYRWITVVNNIITDENGNEEVYFNNDIVLNLNGELSSSNMSITKDGQEYVIRENGKITEEGVYKVYLNESNNTQAYSDDEINNKIKEQEEYIRNEYNIKSNNNEGNYQLEFVVDKTAPEVSEIKTNIAIEEEFIDASEFILAKDKYNNVFYSYIVEPDWSQLGKQNINIQISDAAGNTTNKELEITIYDKCDIDNSGKVDIFDLAETSIHYNKSENSVDWNKRLDFNKDGIIDIFDLVSLSKKL